MSTVRPLSHEHHRGKRWRRYTDYRFAASHAVIPLTVLELPRAAMSLPIGFIAQGEEFVPVAVMGLKPGENLLVAPDGRWIGAYVPAALRAYPFALVLAEGDKEVLCIDEASGLVVDGPDGELFFDESDAPSSAIAQVMAFLQQVSGSWRATRAICACLKAHGLIQPWPMLIQAEADERRFDGLWRIDEAALNALPGEAFLEVRAAGGLPLAYSQLLSMQHMQLLGQLASARLGAAAAMSKLPVTPAGELDLEFLNANEPIDFSKFK